MMDKYGVAINDDRDDKTASQNRACPGCGGTNVNWRGQTPHCARCGTRPWEQKPRSTRGR